MSNQVGLNYYKKGAIISYVTIIINIISSLLYTPWMLSKIGESNYGLYTLATTFINIFLVDFGFSSAVSRFISKYRAEGNQEKIDNFLGMIYKLYGIITGIVFVVLIVLYFFVDKIYVSLTTEELVRFKVVYLIAGSYTILSFPFSSTLNGIMTSCEKYYQMKVCELLHKVLTVALIIVALSGGLGLYALVTVNALTGVINIVLKISILRKTTKIKVNFKFFDKTILKEIFSFSIWVTVSAICSRLIFNITPSVLAIMVGSSAITMFNLASTIEGYTYTFSSAVDGMFMPKIARLVKEDPSCKNVEYLLNKVGRIQFFIIILIVMGFCVVGKEFVSLWLGSDYIEVYYCAILLIIPAPFYLSQQIAKNTVVVLGKVKYQAFVNIAKSAVNIILVVIFSKFWGVLGAATSICISYLVRNVGLNIIYQKVLGLNMLKFHYNCYVKTLPGVILTAICGVVFNRLLPNYSWITLFIKILLICVCYVAFVWLLSFNKGERDLVKGIILKNHKRG